MNTLIKNLIAGAMVGSLAVAGVVTAQEDIKHKTIEIKMVKDSDVSVWVDSDGHAETVVLTANEISNSDLLADKLAGLDEQTRETVVEALEGIKTSGFGDAHVEVKKVFVMNKGDAQLVEFMGDDVNMDIEMITGDDHKIVRKHIIHSDSEGGVLKGHTNAIAKLIERGEFSQEELDKIQAALDAKR